METRLQKKLKRGSYIVQTLYRSYKDNTFLFEAKQQPTCHARPNTLWNIKCTRLAHIREIFYSANSIKELFQKIDMKNVMSFLKAVNIYIYIYIYGKI